MSDLITRLKAPASYNQDYYDLHIEAANEIERLERELEAVSKQRDKWIGIADSTAMEIEELRNELDVEFVRANNLGAQCAAMRTIVEKIAIPESEPAWPVLTRLDFAEARKALSPNAGQKVLDVVKRTQELIEAIDAGALEMNSPEIGGDSEDSGPPHRWHEEWLHLTRQALSALGWKP